MLSAYKYCENRLGFTTVLNAVKCNMDELSPLFELFSRDQRRFVDVIFLRLSELLGASHSPRVDLP